MKKKILGILSICLTISIISGCTKMKPDAKTLSDEEKFKYEYESLNGKKRENRDENLISIEIMENNNIKYSTYEEIKEILTSKSGVIYFGYPQCPWCRNLVPTLCEAGDASGLENIYYYNLNDLRDSKKLVDGKIVTEKQGDPKYHELVKILYDYLPVYKEIKDPSVKRLYFPFVVFVKDGKVVDTHFATIDSQKDYKVYLTKEQQSELKNILIEKIKKVKDVSYCDKGC